MKSKRFKSCSVEACERNAHSDASGIKDYCNAHYKRIRKYGTPKGGFHSADNTGTCSLAECELPALNLGLCSKHYQRQYYNGTTESALGDNRGGPDLFIMQEALKYKGTPCLIWPYYRNANGYGVIASKREGQTTIASRRICELVHGPAPTPEHHAAHLCGKGHLGCVAPEHVRWATSQENSDDTIEHGTNKIKARGEAHLSAKLTEADVRAVRKLLVELTHKQIAARYGVKPETIAAISARKTWAWLE